MTHITCRLTAKNRDRLRNSTFGNRVWATFLPFTYIYTDLSSAKNRENESEALAQDDRTVKADWKRWNYRWRLKVDTG